MVDTLLVAAVVPAAVLLYYVYKLDPVEKEPGRLLAALLGFGALACIPAIILEEAGTAALLGGQGAYNLPTLLLENFIVVAMSEEVCKFFFLRWRTWKHAAFDYVFDGIVYAVFVSLGFAILENIGYVYEYGMGTAVARAFTAIPGHAIFGVFMGCFYGLAKRAQYAGQKSNQSLYLVLALVVPILCHGFYDFCASIDSAAADLVFFGFLFALMAVAMRLVKHMARQAHPLYDPTAPMAAQVQQAYSQYNQYGQYAPLVDNSLDAQNPTRPPTVFADPSLYPTDPNRQSGLQ